MGNSFYHRTRRNEQRPSRESGRDMRRRYVESDDVQVHDGRTSFHGLFYLALPFLIPEPPTLQNDGRRGV